LSELLQRQAATDKQLAKRERQLALEAELQAAFRERNAQRCSEAINEAKLAGVDKDCPAMAQALAVVEPARLHEALVQVGSADSEQRLAALRVGAAERGGGMRVEDFVSATAEAANHMDAPQLRKRAAELASAIVAHKNLLQRELEEESKRATDELKTRCLGRVERSLEQYTRDRDRLLRERTAAMELAQEAETERELAAMRERIAAEAEEEVRELRELASADKERRLAEERSRLERRLASVLVPVVAIEEIVEKGQSVGQRAVASSSLASATLRVADALVAGNDVQAELLSMQEACRSDSFVSRILALLPGETKDWSRGLVPTEPQLQLTFEAQLSDFVAAAFAPPTPSVEHTTLLTGLLSRFHARAFASLYVLSASEAPEPEIVSCPVAKTPTEKTHQNLQVLARASRLVKQGDLRDALVVLDEMLSGVCRERAADWMQDARNTLLLQQTSRVLQAQARCLNATLHAE